MYGCGVFMGHIGKNINNWEKDLLSLGYTNKDIITITEGIIKTYEYGCTFRSLLGRIKLAFKIIFKLNN